MAIKDITKIKKHLFLCNGGSCLKNGAEEATVTLRKEISRQGLDEVVHTTKTLCNGRCQDGPVVIAQPDGIWFRQMGKEHAEDFVNEFIIKGNIPEDKVLYRYGEESIHDCHVTH